MMRSAHRWVAAIILVFTAYFGLTGTSIQLIDLWTLARHAPADDPNMLAIRESIDGTQNFRVIDTADYSARSLPPGLNLETVLHTLLHAARTSPAGAQPMSFAEVRMIGTRPVGQARLGDQTETFDAETGVSLPGPIVDRQEHRPSRSLRGSVKGLHRLSVFGDGILWLNTLVGIGLGGMVVTGSLLYIRLLAARARTGRRSLFWSAGGWWRSFHRWIAVAAMAFLAVVSVSGSLLSIDSFYFGLYRQMHPDRLVGGFSPVGTVADLSAPLDDKHLASMLTVTLQGYRDSQGSRPIKVLRLRSFSGMLQGVVVSGGAETRQFVFNAVTGARASMTEPGYPDTGFPFGWEEHELMKRIHRGDVIGLPGRLMDLFAGLSLLYLSVSGGVMYIDLWRRRKRAGRPHFFWV